MRQPVFAQASEGGAGQGDIAVAASLAVNVQEHAVALDVGDGEMGSFEEPQAAGINRDETGAVDGKANATQDAANLLATEDDGSFFSRCGRARPNRVQVRSRVDSKKNLMPHRAMVKLARAKCFTLIR